MPALPVAGSTPRDALVGAYRECWSSLLAVGGGLTEHQWAAPSLCPGWSCRDVLIHLTSAEVAFAGWTPSASPPWEVIAEAATGLGPMAGADVLAAFAGVTEQRGEQLASMSDAELDAVGWTPAGTGPYRRYLEIRVFDHWAHEQDVRVPLGLPGHLEGLAAEMSLDEAHLAFGYLIGKRAAAPEGSSVTIEITGPTARLLHARVDGRAQVVEVLDNPTAGLGVDFSTFMLLCCGRMDPEGPIAEGRLRFEGDVDLGRRVARNLAFTI